MIADDIKFIEYPLKKFPPNGKTFSERYGYDEIAEAVPGIINDEA